MDKDYVIVLLAVVGVSAFLVGVIVSFSSLTNPNQYEVVCKPYKVRLDQCHSVCPQAEDIDQDWGIPQQPLNIVSTSYTTTTYMRFNDG